MRIDEPMTELVKIYVRDERWDEAEETAMEMYGEIRERLEDRDRTINVLAMLQQIYLSSERWDKLDSIADRLISTSKEVLGETHPSTLHYMANQASAYRHLDKKDEAIRIQREVVRLRIQEQGQDHQDTYVSRMNLAMSLSSQEEAAREMQIAAEGLMKVQGESNPSTIQALKHLGTMLNARGNVTTGISHVERKAMQMWQDERDRLRRTSSDYAGLYTEK
jgi:hypothetical protein